MQTYANICTHIHAHRHMHKHENTHTHTVYSSTTIFTSVHLLIPAIIQSGPHMAEVKCIKSFTIQELQLMFTSNLNMNSSNIDRGMIVDTRQAGLNISNKNC